MVVAISKRANAVISIRVWVEKIVNTGIFITTDPKKGVKTKKEIIEKSIIK